MALVANSSNQTETVWLPSSLRVFWGLRSYFYGSPDAKLAPLGWKNISKAMDQLAKEQDEVMESLNIAAYSPILNKERAKESWLYCHPADVSPKPPRPRPKPITMPYEELMKQWRK